MKKAPGSISSSEREEGHPCPHVVKFHDSEVSTNLGAVLLLLSFPGRHPFFNELFIVHSPTTCNCTENFISLKILSEIILTK